MTIIRHPNYEEIVQDILNNVPVKTICFKRNVAPSTLYDIRRRETKIVRIRRGKPLPKDARQLTLPLEKPNA